MSVVAWRRVKPWSGALKDPAVPQVPSYFCSWCSSGSGAWHNKEGMRCLLPQEGGRREKYVRQGSAYSSREYRGEAVVSKLQESPL